MTTVAGVDGCKGGWMIASAELSPTGTLDHINARVAYDFQTVLDLHGGAKAIVVDIPVGIPDETVRGGRACDREARGILKPLRTSSVFNPPSRDMLSLTTYSEVARKAGLSAQCYALIPKIHEVHSLLSPKVQERVLESHPEVVFATAAGRPMTHPKRSLEGHTERLQVLKDCDFHTDVNGLFHSHRASLRKALAADDDLVDAYALLWLAGQKVLGRARTIPANPPRDSKGLRMEMWCVSLNCR